MHDRRCPRPIKTTGGSARRALGDDVLRAARGLAATPRARGAAAELTERREDQKKRVRRHRDGRGVRVLNATGRKRSCMSGRAAVAAPTHAPPGPVGARNAHLEARLRLEARAVCLCVRCFGRPGQLEPHRQHVQDQGRESHAAKSRAKLAQEAATLIQAATGSRLTCATWSVSSSCARQRESAEGARWRG